MLDKLSKITKESRKEHKLDVEPTSTVKVEVEERVPNEEQRQAIEADVNVAVRVLAPPGSGKTFIIENRYKFLLDNGVSPNQILAVTFTKKMATELYERILSSNKGIVGSNADKQVCTIHAACFRILYAEGMRLQVAKEWQVKKLLTDDKVGIIQKLWGFDKRPGWRELENWIAMPKRYAVVVEDSLDFYNQRLPKQATKLAEARRLFDEGLQRQRLFTFSDMMYLAERLFIDRPEVLKKYQEKYTHIIIDEGQDTSAQAMRILTLLAKPQDNLIIVGDPDQMLFRFAGATPEDNLYEGFERRYPDAISVLLKINYRSTGAIVRACRQLIDTNYHDRGGPYSQEYRKAIEARPGVDEGELIHFQMYKKVEDEANATIDTIEELITGEYDPGNIFVGARTRAQLGYLEGGLVRKKIPFVNISGGSFWASKHVKHLTSYAALTNDTTDKDAFLEVYNIGTNEMTYPWGPQKGQYCNHRWLGKAFLQVCNSEYKNINQAAWQKRMWQVGVLNLKMFVTELQMRLESDTPTQVLQFIIDDCYRNYLVADEGLLVTDQESPEGTKFDDLSTVVDVAGQFDNMSDFLSYVRDAQRAAEAVEKKKLDEYVVLSTIHSLKGLERKVVFGLGMSEGETIGAGGGVSQAGLLPHTFSLVKPPQMGVLPVGGMGRVEDERCAAYVLVSRAKERVFLSGCGTYKKSTFRSSRFIEELGIEENYYE